MKELQNLEIDAALRNTNNFKLPDDVFNRFFRFSDNKGINNTSGFRAKSKFGKSSDIESCAFCVLVTTFNEAEWPDAIDLENGIFTYFGDKRKSGELHETALGGNRFLKKIFTDLHMQARTNIPPLLVFENYKEKGKAYMRFLGLAVPGAAGLSPLDDLVAVWRVKEASRFQNYRAIFTILKDDTIPKSWLEELVTGIAADDSQFCPPAYAHWVKTGRYQPLTCERKRQPRTKKDQQPRGSKETALLKKLKNALTDREFEFAAVDITGMMDPRFVDFLVTQRVRDGGRDAVGYYRVGHDDHQVRLNVYVEAKRWIIDIGVKPMARLISRIKHRDIGVFVSTSCFSKQVQQELIDDNHPVIIISGGDITRLLMARELDVDTKFDAWIADIQAKAVEFL